MVRLPAHADYWDVPTLNSLSMASAPVVRTGGTDLPGQARDWNGSGNASRWPGAMTFRYVEVWGVLQSAPALWTLDEVW